MTWTKVRDSGEEDCERYYRLTPEGLIDELPADMDYPVVVLSSAACRCNLIDAYQDGYIVVYDDIDEDIGGWSSSDVENISDGGWAMDIFQKFYGGSVRMGTSQAKVNF